MSQLGIVALFFEMDYLRMLKIALDIMCGESNKNIAFCTHSGRYYESKV